MPNVIRVKPVDHEKTARMVTLMIVKDEFLKEISPLLDDVSFFQGSSGYFPTVLRWVLDYGKKYDRAPRDYIKKIFEKYKKKVGNDDANVKLIEMFLTRLDHDYVSGNFDDVDVKFELEEAEALIQERALLNNERLVRETTTSQGPVEADKIREAFVLPQLGGGRKSIKETLTSNLLSMTDLIEEKIEESEFILEPWLAEETLNMVYGPTGIGKTFFNFIIAATVTRENSKGLSIGPWIAGKPTGVLYIDGEMGQQTIQKRMAGLLKPLGPEAEENPLTFISVNRMSKKDEMRVNICQPQWRKEIYETLKADDRYNLLFLDNLGCLAPGLDENSKEDWDPIGDWMRSLKHLGVTVILIHHPGKDKRQGPRGTISRTDAMDNIIRLGSPPNGNSGHGACFQVIMEKHRDLEVKPHPFTLRVASLDRGRGITWTVEEKPPDDREMEALKLLAEDNGMNQKQIAKLFTVSPGTITNWKKAASKKGLWNLRADKPTREGWAAFDEMDGDDKLN